MTYFVISKNVHNDYQLLCGPTISGDLTITGDIIHGGVKYIFPAMLVDDEFVMRTLVQTITNKTLTAPIIDRLNSSYSANQHMDWALGQLDITIASTAYYRFDQNRFTLQASRDLRLDGGKLVDTAFDEFALPNSGANDQLIARNSTDTLTNKTLTTPIIASVFIDAGKTKLMTFKDKSSDEITVNDGNQILRFKSISYISNSYTGNHVVTIFNHHIDFRAGGGAQHVCDFPAANTVTGKKFIVQSTDAVWDIKVISTAGSLIEGLANFYIPLGRVFEFVSNGLSYLTPNPYPVYITMDKTAGQPINSGATQPVFWPTNVTQSKNYAPVYSGVTHTFTIQKKGTYAMSVDLTWSFSAAGYRSLWYRINGTTRKYSHSINPAFTFSPHTMTIALTRHFVVGDTIEVIALQTSGIALVIGSGAAGWENEFNLTRISDTI
jgi:hypothetical protein